MAAAPGVTRDKSVTCYFWATNGHCQRSDEDCSYAHYHTGTIAPQPPGTRHAWSEDDSQDRGREQKDDSKVRGRASMQNRSTPVPAMNTSGSGTVPEISSPSSAAPLYDPSHSHLTIPPPEPYRPHSQEPLLGFFAAESTSPRPSVPRLQELLRGSEPLETSPSGLGGRRPPPAIPTHQAPLQEPVTISSGLENRQPRARIGPWNEEPAPSQEMANRYWSGAGFRAGGPESPIDPLRYNESISPFNPRSTPPQSLQEAQSDPQARYRRGEDMGWDPAKMRRFQEQS
ncbi:MAG: hypothetical protein Q9191_006663 [Dirinaria sp. TL-2023a]